MASNTSFKISCPSCEASIPIRDSGLIGRKIECPKCKYKVLVEDPNDGDEGDARPARKGAPARKGGGNFKAKKKSGNYTMIIVGAAVGVVAVLVLALGAWWLMSGGGDSPKPSTPNKAVASNPTPQPGTVQPGGVIPPPPVAPPDEGGLPNAVAVGPGGNIIEQPPAGGGDRTPTTPNAAPPRSAAGDITNLMPGDAQTVVSIHMDHLRTSTFGQQAFESRVGVKPEVFKQKLGLGIDEMTRLVRGENLDQGWSFNVLRTTRPVGLRDFETPLGLTKGPKSPIQGREYYTMAPNELLDHLATIVQAELESKDSKEPVKAPKSSASVMSFLLLDSTTVVIAQQDMIEEFLQNGAKFDQRSQITPAGGRGAPAGGAGGGGGGDAGTAGGGGDGLPSTATVGPGGGGAPQRGRGNRGGGGGGGGQFTSRGTFLTIEPNLKAMLDHMEGDGRQVTATLAQRVQYDPKIVNKLRETTGLPQFEVAGMDIFGTAINQFSLEKVKGQAGILFVREATAQGFEEEIRRVMSLAAVATGLYLGGLPVAVTGGGAGGGGRAGGGGGIAGGGDAGTSGGSSDLPGTASVGSGGGGAASADGPPAGGTPGGRGGQAQPARSSIGLSRQGRSVYFDVDLTMNERAYDRVYALSESSVMRMRGLVDMADSHPRWHELAGAGVNLRKDGSYPRGTFPREETVGTRLMRTWRPDQRVSWMVNLLPFLGQEDLFQQIDKKKNWRDDENLKHGAVLIPQFLNPLYPRQSWRAAVPSLGLRDQGATHFVGVAGVGIDAADYAANNPAVAKKLGVFGYDRRTEVKDITDGLANTIYMLQVPPTHQRPWIAGGGATITGIPETNSVKPFVATQANGKRGTYALMADGSVRFISESISDDVLKAMATIRGGESIDDLAITAPKVDPPKTSEMKTNPGGGSGGK